MWCHQGRLDTTVTRGGGAEKRQQCVLQVHLLTPQRTTQFYKHTALFHGPICQSLRSAQADRRSADARAMRSRLMVTVGGSRTRAFWERKQIRLRKEGADYARAKAEA